MISIILVVARIRLRLAAPAKCWRAARNSYIRPSHQKAGARVNRDSRTRISKIVPAGESTWLRHSEVVQRRQGLSASSPGRRHRRRLRSPLRHPGKQTARAVAGQGAVGSQPKARPPAPINPVRMLQTGCSCGHDRRLTSSAHSAGADRSMDVIAVAAKAPQ
jgi:hypothetical protein